MKIFEISIKFFKFLCFSGEQQEPNWSLFYFVLLYSSVASKLYGVYATIIIFVFFCIVLYCIVLYCIVLYCIVLYCIFVYCIVLYCILLYCIVLYCIVMFCLVL